MLERLLRLLVGMGVLVILPCTGVYFFVRWVVTGKTGDPLDWWVEFVFRDRERFDDSMAAVERENEKTAEVIWQLLHRLDNDELEP